MNHDSNGLASLKNIGAASVNILHAVGINSFKQRKIHVSKVMLYALQGALMDTHWNELAPELKQQLLEDAGEVTV